MRPDNMGKKGAKRLARNKMPEKDSTLVPRSTTPVIKINKISIDSAKILKKQALQKRSNKHPSSFSSEIFVMRSRKESPGCGD